ncbi:acyl-CoA thioester hydrolase YciA [Candidatus Symbiopectobacterium sp.]|uniref:acyl-CoA thioester hydrolase YciA n=1 Tax=Candidatus Symbiopectobacterium sp. TaxID=2816440 RepID=UPI0025C43F5D|nr:acyl-CoA thioester hydrolase YciA [Candidatus Symbiopectobacterium sp.]
MSTTQTAPHGELVLRTLAMPADTNANGDIFGGWLMSQMDIGGAIMAKEIAEGRVVTVRVDGMSFLKPVAVGDVVCCYARCLRTGRSSLDINVEVWVKKVSTAPIGQRYRATQALFTYVAVDETGHPCELPAGKSHFTAPDPAQEHP